MSGNPDSRIKDRVKLQSHHDTLKLIGIGSVLILLGVGTVAGLVSYLHD